MGFVLPQPHNKSPAGPMSLGMGVASETTAAEEKGARREDFMVWMGMRGMFCLKSE